MSADVGADNGARTKKTPKARQRATPAGKKSRPSTSHREPPVEPELPQSVATAALEATVVPAAVPPALLPAPEPVAPLATPLVAQQPPAPLRRTTHLRAIAVAGSVILVVAALTYPRQPSAPGTDDDAADSQPAPQEQAVDIVARSPLQAALPVAPIAAPVVRSASVAPRAVSAPKKTVAPKPEKNRIAESTKSGAPVAAATPVADSSLHDDAPTKLRGSEAIALAPGSASTGTSGATPVTITGCLEMSVDQDEFRLTDTEGVDAPRSRNWRTGFLKKRSAPVALVEPAERLALQTHVGRRIAATGLLTSHDLKISALRVVGPQCN